jgi:hypothetical protein
MAEIKAVPIQYGNKDMPGPTLAQFTVTKCSIGANSEIFITAELESDKAVDDAVKQLCKEVKIAGEQAKRILTKDKAVGGAK